jgi:outer membrane protein TolC
MGYLPRLNAFGSYEMYDTSIFATSAKGYLIGAQLSWNVFDGYKTIGKSEKAKAEFQKSETASENYKKQSQLELNKTKRQLIDAEIALEQSQEAYRIRQNRFQQGLEKTTDLLTSETQTIQKELEHLQAVFEYNFTKNYLQFLTK